MADYRISDVLIYVSKTRESALNTGETTGSNFLKAITQSPSFYLPQVEFVDDSGRPGNGHEFRQSEWCATYLSHSGLSLSDDINVGYCGRLALRSVGSSVTTAQQGGSAAYKHSATMLDALTSLQMPSTTAIVALGGASFRLDGLVVDRFRLSQQAANRVQYACDLVGTGDFVTPHGVSSLPAAAVLTNCLTGQNSEVKWTDTAGTENFATGCVLKSWFAEIANSTKLNDRCPGDPTVTITDSASSRTVTPAYVQKLRHGIRSATGQIVVPLDSTIPHWYTYAAGDPLTNVIFRGQGDIIASTYRYSVGIIFPKAQITSVETGEVDGEATLTINISASWDTVTSSAATVEVFNAETSAYV